MSSAAAATDTQSISGAGKAVTTMNIPRGIVHPKETFQQIEKVEKQLRKSPAEAEQLASEFELITSN